MKKNPGRKDRRAVRSFRRKPRLRGLPHPMATDKEARARRLAERAAESRRRRIDRDTKQELSDRL